MSTEGGAEAEEAALQATRRSSGDVRSGSTGSPGGVSAGLSGPQERIVQARPATRDARALGLALGRRGIAGLQRRAGNRTVARLLASGQDQQPTQRRPAVVESTGEAVQRDGDQDKPAGAPPMTQHQQAMGDIADAIDKGQWARAVSLTQALTDPADVASALGNHAFAQYAGLSNAAKEAGAAGLFDQVEPLRIAALDAEYDSALRSSAWSKAAGLASWYNDTDLPNKLPKGVDALTSLKAEADRQGLARLSTTIEPLRVAALNAEYAAAVAAGNWQRAALLINAYSDSDLNKHLDEIQAAGHAGDLDAASVALQGPMGRVHRTIRFRANGLGAAAPNNPPPRFTVTNPGSVVTGPGSAVGGGTVTVTTGVDYSLAGGGTGTGGYTLGYAGAESARTRWLQFIWREVISQSGAHPPVWVAGSIRTSGGSYDLTTDTTAPSYNTDAGPTAPNPYYETSGTHVRDPSSETMLDDPQPLLRQVGAAFAAGADNVISRAHFSTYLVREMSVLFRVNLTIEWKFDRTTNYGAATGTITVPTKTQRVDGTQPVSAIDPRMRQRLVAQFPSVDYLP